MTDIHTRNKALINHFRRALYDLDPGALKGQLNAMFAPDAKVHLATPFEDLDGADGLYEVAYRPLIAAIPDVERRDFIVMAGEDKGENWVGCAGHYVGVFEYPWLDIPPTQHIIGMRYHEFFRIIDDQIVEMQALWDIPQLMMQSGTWPMSPSLGVDWLVPGPATNDGIISGPHDPAASAASRMLVGDMLAALGKSTIGVEAMELDRRWHPKMIWYGPSGIGSMRRISGFRNWHQIPFLAALPDRVAVIDSGPLFADGNYVGFTAWPGMKMTVSGDGWLGIAPSNQKITMRSLDFWRCENGLIRENWVLIDLLHVYKQLGVDVLARMREYTYGRRHLGTGALQK